MPRDIQKRFDELGVELTVEEVALTGQDVIQYHLPQNPFSNRLGKKKGDPRHRWYVETYGIQYGVELDALLPEVLGEKIIESIERYLDLDILRSHKLRDEEDREIWQEVVREKLSGT